MKRILSVLMAAVLLISLTACASESKTSVSSVEGEISASVNTVSLDLAGQWKQVNSSSDDSYQAAIIEGDTIEIYWVTESDDSYSLYWSGTFVAPKTAKEPYTWESENNHDKTDYALLASTDDTKTITYESGQLSYSASALGTTQTVKLEREDHVLDAVAVDSDNTQIAEVEIEEDATEESSAEESEEQSEAVDASGYSRTNPAPAGVAQTITIEDYDQTYTVTIVVESVLRGDSAYNAIMEAYEYNDPAPDGMEYALVYISATVDENSTDGTVYFSDFSFDAFSSSGQGYDYTFVLVPDPEFSGEAYAGGTVSGYAAFLVNDDDEQPVIAYGRDYDGTGGIWFSLEASDAVSPSGGETATNSNATNTGEGASSTISSENDAGVEQSLDAIASYLEDSFGENYTVGIEGNYVTAGVWSDGLVAGTLLAIAGSQDYIDEWSSIVESSIVICEYLQYILIEYGCDEYSALFTIRNDINTDNVLLTICNGVVLYDIVNGIDMIGSE